MTNRSTRTAKDWHLCVIGCGQIGGSLLRALRNKVACLSAVDSSPSTRQYLVEHQLAHAVSADIEASVATADVVVLAAPVQANLALVPRLSGHLKQGALLTDVSSTKALVVEAMEATTHAEHSVGGHPMCGTERAGIQAADPTLFQGRPYVLCPGPSSGSAAQEMAETLAGSLGAMTRVMNATDHDRAVSRVSHIAYLLAAILVELYADLPEPARELAASGFRDTSRLAACDPTMMADILLTNSQQITDTLAAAATRLTQLGHLIDPEKSEALFERLNAVQRTREEWSERYDT